ncbi:hypothetical protein CDIK_4267, partial [Cucumispora dikerogammari]
GIESELNLLDAESTGTAEVLSHSPRATHTISLPLSTGSQTTMPTVNSITPVQLPSPPTRRTYAKIDQVLRRVVCEGYDRGESVNRLAAIHSVAKGSVRSIIKNYLSEGRINTLSRGGDNSSKLSFEQKNAIVDWVNENPIYTLKQLKLKVFDSFEITCSTSTIDRVLTEFHYTLKRLVLSPVTRNSERTLEKRFEYAQAYRALEETVPAENFVFLDEVGFQVVSRPKRGRALRGQVAVTYTPGARSRNISVMAAISKAGVLYHTIRNSAFNGEAFKSSLVELNSVCQQKGIINPVFVLDNCRIHHYTGLRVTIEGLGLNLMFLPPYSPFLNPIENVFSVWKNEVIRAGSKNEQELNETISSTFTAILPSVCEAFYRKMLRYLNKSTNREIINE